MLLYIIGWCSGCQFNPLRTTQRKLDWAWMPTLQYCLTLTMCRITLFITVCVCSFDFYWLYTLDQMAYLKGSLYGWTSRTVATQIWRHVLHICVSAERQYIWQPSLWTTITLSKYLTLVPNGLKSKCIRYYCLNFHCRHKVIFWTYTQIKLFCLQYWLK